MRFIGNIEAKADAKGRVFLPSAFRKALAVSADEEEGRSGRIVMRMDPFQPCMTLYPESAWNQTVDALRGRLNKWNATHQAIFRQFVNDVEVMELDASGRFLIPKRYLQKAGIIQNVRFIGMDDSIELWGAERFEESLMTPEDFGKALEDVMGQDLKFF